MSRKECCCLVFQTSDDDDEDEDSRFASDALGAGRLLPRSQGAEDDGGKFKEVEKEKGIFR